MMADGSRGVYHLGNAPEELLRQERQARALLLPSRTILAAAGIGPGMAVLDLGCGPGDLSLLAAELVAPGGQVVGLDRSQEAVDYATARVAALGLESVRFVIGDLYDPPVEGMFD